MKENERVKFIITGIAKDIRKVGDKEELVYKFKIKDSKMELLFKTKKAYESEYDTLLGKTNCISAVVQYINEKRKNVVISGIRYLKNEPTETEKVG